MESPKTILPMQTLVLCSDVQFLGTTRSVLTQFQVTPRIAANCDEAAALIDSQEFDVIILDWREISNLADFLSALRRSKLNRECVLVAIVRDLLDLRQAFAAGVLFLIHKPPSTLQIERCLRAAYCATVARRRKQHREPVDLLATISTHAEPYAEVIVTNLSEGGAGIVTHCSRLGSSGTHLSAGDEIDLRFSLPESEAMVHASGRVVWTTNQAAGIRFTAIPENDRAPFQSWLTDCVERSLAALCEKLRCA
ncbi:MAG TPA: response regulator [Candidatus Sulfotelmatobacter sp.]|nr:response regulator [Candidatus Sulfotelmatobacter sp.]